ncbi:MAG TPA: M56 family metallopeptidase [Gammaproteobacteria bacterium]|nr:M56 family metallopeptidase [Gammaproteobacteria bacterium]
MSTFTTLLDSALLSTLGWTLVHFLWQGAAAGLLYALLRHWLRNKSPVARYNLAMLTLMTLALLPIITFIHLYQPATSTNATAAWSGFTTVTAANAHSGAAAFLPWLNNLHAWLNPWLSWAVLLWFMGVLIMTLRVGHGWQRAHRLRRTAEFPPLPQWESIVKDLSVRLGIRRVVRLAVSVHILVPSMIGWLKPVILLPPSVISGLTPLQIELILAHELAHVRRWDYLWNLVQLVVETLLFYHPVVRWISNQARVEREQCCDDLVVALHGNPLDYARALTELEGLRHPRSALMLGANGGQVLDRIHRLLGNSAVSMPAAWGPVLLAAGMLLAGGLMSSNQIRALWHGAAAVRYSLTGQSVENATTSTVLPVSLQPTRIQQTPVIRIDSRHVSLSASTSAPQTASLPPLAALHAPAASAPTPVTAAYQDTAPVREGGELISRYAPEYPAFAQERGVEGAATVEFTLAPDAEIKDVRVAKVTGSQLFGQAAVHAIQRWKFTPVTVDGQPVAQQMSVEFVFRLHAATTETGGPCKAPMGYHVCIN